MDTKLPKVKNKKKINVEEFVRRAKQLKVYYEEEIEYLRKKKIENENLLSGKSI